MRQLIHLLAPIALGMTFLGLPPAARADTPAGAATRLQAFLDGVPELGPGYAVVIVDREGRVLEYVRGQRNARTGAPLTLDTPIYIASQTKSYMGLLAHVLDRRGILPLESTLADAWPGLVWPAGFDADAWTLSDLLNHRVPIEADTIAELEAYIHSPDPAQYPRLLEAFAEPREPGFRYDNIGYNIYAAILAHRTGKRWQDWLAQEVFAPLDLDHTSARTSDFAADALAYSHVWQGDDAGWAVVPPKADAIMQSAGGMMTSPGDMARWLRFQLGAVAVPGLDADVLDAAHRVGAQVDPKARNAYELPCNGYAFGWNVCDFRGHRLYIHGGSYTGARTLMAFTPDLGIGIGVFSNSDNMTGWLTSRTVVQYLQYLTDHPDADKWAGIRQAQYPQRTAKLLESRRADLEASRADPAWGGWTWKPDAHALAEYAGRYRGMRLPVVVDLMPTAGGLLLREGARRLRLAPASPDLFGTTWLPLDPPEPLRFERDAGGRILGFEHDGERYLLQASGSSLR